MAWPGGQPCHEVLHPTEGFHRRQWHIHPAWFNPGDIGPPAAPAGHSFGSLKQSHRCSSLGFQAYKMKKWFLTASQGIRK